MQDATIVLIKPCLFLALESMHQQVGKDVCYRRTAAFKAHMRHYINEGKIFNFVSLGQYNKEKHCSTSESANFCG